MKNSAPASLAISSNAFREGEMIPIEYSCDGEHVNPPLNIAQIPEGTQTLAIIMDDPDAPKGTYDHWIVWNIPVFSSIPANTNPGISGVNSAGKTGYHGPCPPSGTHRYFFHVFALDSRLDILAGETRQVLEKAMENHIIGQGTLMGKYGK
ncbi:YbhB/YbcL family Raf kinase inhibitor-like protein [Flavihumibacter solisilvae]|uniref:Phosphatidylethanolamine-binding protein n=1 Tax=Flavihumibacter solisilvae TaxID=1349421 RepID=A0A0C1INA5_9BACT|nr:YbhB/YbcL family Raf kinase inhibitor-like protein [Flavihumibacter solisilvae]KIC95715.1 phosphatidylethanolamine-binding protein [Flavihumibacter solisilvae]